MIIYKAELTVTLVQTIINRTQPNNDINNKKGKELIQSHFTKCRCNKEIDLP